MRQIVVMTTGGTIAMRRDPQAGGAIPALRGEDFMAQLPPSEVKLQFESFSNVPSSHLTPAQMFGLSQRINTLLEQPEIDGVVITHGTDTLEESAFLLDLTVASVKPVVLTGAMRTATAIGYDGIANLMAAVRVAAAPEAVGAGVLVVFNETIFAASSVQKTHSQDVDAFSAPGVGPLGRVEGNRVWLTQRPANRQVFPCSRLEERVELIRVVQGGEDRQLRHAINDRMAGVVLETLGGGRVPPWWLPAITDALAHRIAIVATTRCGAGSLYDEYGYVGAFHDLQRLGVLFAHNLNGVKTRIKLMAALGMARRHADLKTWFN